MKLYSPHGKKIIYRFFFLSHTPEHNPMIYGIVAFVLTSNIESESFSLVLCSMTSPILRFKLKKNGSIIILYVYYRHYTRNCSSHGLNCVQVYIEHSAI